MNAELRTKIANKQAHIVVLGLGYVGLPVACLFAQTGFRVSGIRRSPDKVAWINRGISPIEGDEPGLAELVQEVVGTGRLSATVDYNICRDADVVLLAVETPVDLATKKPEYHALRSALTDLGHHLSPATLVIVESTIAPGTMDRLVRPLLEEISGLRANEDFFLVNCPERVMPGKLLANIRDCDRVVGGMSPQAAELAAGLYKNIVHAELDIVDCLTAELVKTMENAYRDVQIAFANEMALLCENMGADVWQVRELVNKSPYRAMHLPGAGVGGHCIPKDPWLLIANAGDSFAPRLIPAARAVNDAMPLHVVDLTVHALQVTGVQVSDARVAVLGYAYLENSDDTRNSPSQGYIEKLRELGADVVVHDPWVPGHQGDVWERLYGCDAAVLMVKHNDYLALELPRLTHELRTPILIDGRHAFDAESAKSAGLIYYGLGQGTQERTG